MKLNFFKKVEQLGVPSKDVIRDIIIYSCMKNGIDFEQISDSSIEKIICKYIELCNEFKIGYVRGELDTFKRAACLLVAINDCGINGLDKDMLVNISIDAGFKMSEQPYWFVGIGCDEPFQLNIVDFDKMFAEESYLLSGREMFVDSVKYDYSNYISHADMLQLWHYVASIRNGIIPGIENSSGYSRIRK